MLLQPSLVLSYFTVNFDVVFPKFHTIGTSARDFRAVSCKDISMISPGPLEGESGLKCSDAVNRNVRISYTIFLLLYFMGRKVLEISVDQVTITEATHTRLAFSSGTTMYIQYNDDRYEFIL